MACYSNQTIVTNKYYALYVYTLEILSILSPMAAKIDIGQTLVFVVGILGNRHQKKFLTDSRTSLLILRKRSISSNNLINKDDNMSFNLPLYLSNAG